MPRQLRESRCSSRASRNKSPTPSSESTNESLTPPPARPPPISRFTYAPTPAGDESSELAYTKRHKRYDFESSEDGGMSFSVTSAKKPEVRTPLS